MQRASAEGHLEIIQTLVKNGVSVDHQDEVVSSKCYLIAELILLLPLTPLIGRIKASNIKFKLYHFENLYSMQILVLYHKINFFVQIGLWEGKLKSSVLSILRSTLNIIFLYYP